MAEIGVESRRKSGNIHFLSGAHRFVNEWQKIPVATDQVQNVDTRILREAHHVDCNLYIDLPTFIRLCRLLKNDGYDLRATFQILRILERERSFCDCPLSRSELRVIPNNTPVETRRISEYQPSVSFGCQTNVSGTCRRVDAGFFPEATIA